MLGLAASAVTVGTRAEADTAQATFAWLLPMTAICALALAVAVAARSASAGAGAGVAAWIILVLASSVTGQPGTPGTPGASGTPRLTTAITDARFYLPYLLVAACCAAAVSYATRPQRGIK